MLRRLTLAHAPTPLQQPRMTARRLGLDLWIKRDDITGGPEAGNKIRKLEYLLADALDRGCDTLITCGGVQSNHARATAVLGRRLGLDSVLMLRETSDERDATKLPPTGNLLLDRLVGADVRLISVDEYRRRAEVMAAVADELSAKGRRPYVIPEGGSNGLGAFGYIRAMEEVARQLELGLAGGKRFDVVVHACGSGGTSAGIALGAAQHQVADEVYAIAVCDDTATFVRTISRIISEARDHDRSLESSARLKVVDQYKGPRYGVSSPEQLESIRRLARESGLILDPVYSGKAFYAVEKLAAEWAGRRVLFIHTGGLPGLMAQGDELGGIL